MSNLIEFAVIALLALGAWLLVGDSPAQTVSSASAPALLAPWAADHEVAPGWFWVGIGRRADGQVAVQMRSPQHKEAAWIVLTTRPDGDCSLSCTQNLQLSVEFGSGDDDQKPDSAKTPVIPSNLKKAMDAVSGQIRKNDQFASPDDILNAPWDGIGPPATSLLPDALRQTFTPAPDTRRALAWFLGMLAAAWLILLSLRKPSGILEFALLAGLLALAAWLRWPELSLPFMEDGSLQRMAYAREPMLDILLMRTPELHHPPLTFIVLRLAIDMGGIAERVVRMPFFLAALGIIPVLYVLTRQLVGRISALLVAALIALHPAMIGLSGEVNDFSLLVLFGFATVALYTRLLNDVNDFYRFILALLAAITINCNMLGLVWIGALVIWDWMLKPAQGRALFRLDSVLILLAASLPVLGMFLRGFMLRASAPAPQRLPGLDWGTEPLPALIADIARFALTPPFGFSLLALALIGVVAILRRPLSRTRTGLLVWLPSALALAIVALALVDRIRAAYTLPILVGVLPLATIPIQNLISRADLSARAILFRAGAAMLAVLLLIGPVFAATASQTANRVNPYARVRLVLSESSVTQTVAVIARTGPLATYHLCGRVELWADREAPGEHACTSQLRIMSLGMPHDWASESIQDLNNRFSRLLAGKPFFLLLGREPAPLLRKWASLRCKTSLSERDLTLLSCPALAAPKR
jgi:hypothetical protein